jgi:3-dehydroquinate synthase
VIKYGVIADRALCDLLGQPVRPQLEEIITRCVSIKRDVVALDEFETGPRKLLNFGHTVGHAVEHLSDYALSHGKAVAVGMAVMARACAAAGICSGSDARAVVERIASCGLPVKTDRSAGELTAAALSDKKRSGGMITLTVMESVGRCALKDIPVQELELFIGPGL